jgi:hypothetical protein
MAARWPQPASQAHLVFGIAALLVLSGCAGIDAPDPQPQATVTEEVTEQSEYPPEREILVRPRPGMLEVEPVRIWYEYARGDDPRTILVTFASQGPPCEVLDSFEVHETGTRVTITLYHGRDPHADPNDPCDGPPDQVSRVAVPLEGDYDFPDRATLINGGSLTDRP